MKASHKPSWHGSRFGDFESDPLSGFANIMDVMLVFALGLMLALISQSQELRQHFKLNTQNLQGIEVTQGSELIETPESIEKVLNNKGDGMESLGTVYRDPETGKLILVNAE